MNGSLPKKLNESRNLDEANLLGEEDLLTGGDVTLSGEMVLGIVSHNLAVDGNIVWEALVPIS